MQTSDSAADTDDSTLTVSRFESITETDKLTKVQVCADKKLFEMYTQLENFVGYLSENN